MSREILGCIKNLSLSYRQINITTVRGPYYNKYFASCIHTRLSLLTRSLGPFGLCSVSE